MRRCLHAKHIDDRMKVRRAGARLAVHVLGAAAANRLHRAFLPVPLSPCLVRCVGSSLCVCSHRGDQNDKPADGRLRAPRRRRARAHPGHALGHERVRARLSGYRRPGRYIILSTKATADLPEAESTEAESPEAEPLETETKPPATETPEPGLRVQDRRTQDRVTV